LYLVAIEDNTAAHTENYGIVPMYRPSWVRPEDEACAWSLIERQPFAALVAASPSGMIASHVPLLRASDGVLEGHMARANPQWRSLEKHPDLLAIFQTASAYISPAWYVDEPDVPTWNYGAVHVYGRFVKSDASATTGILQRAVRRFSHDGWSLDSLAPDFIAELERHVVGFSIEVSSIEVAMKMSQDKTEADRARVCSALQAAGDPGATAVAALMAATRSRR
jgi:transcriptional regulator